MPGQLGGTPPRGSHLRREDPSPPVGPPPPEDGAGPGCERPPTPLAVRWRRPPAAGGPAGWRQRSPAGPPNAVAVPVVAIRRTPLGRRYARRSLDSWRSSGKCPAALAPAGLDDGPPGPGRHTVAEAMVLGPLPNIRLIGTFHSRFLLGLSKPGTPKQADGPSRARVRG